MVPFSMAAPPESGEAVLDGRLAMTSVHGFAVVCIMKGYCAIQGEASASRKAFGHQPTKTRRRRHPLFVCSICCASVRLTADDNNVAPERSHRTRLGALG